MITILQIIAGFFIEVWALLRGTECDLQDNSRVGTSQFEREGRWIWPVIIFGLMLIGVGIQYCVKNSF